MILGAVLWHGVCYDFLFIAGQLYVDGESNERNRGAAQGFIAFILWGVGAFVGTMVAGQVMGRYKWDEPVGTIAHDWPWIWLTPAVGAAAGHRVVLAFLRVPP